MNDEIRAQEKAYWQKEAHRRFLDVEAARARNDPPYLLAAAELRSKEANERLIELQKADGRPSAI